MANPVLWKVTSVADNPRLQDLNGNTIGYIGQGETLAYAGIARDYWNYDSRMLYAYTTKGFTVCFNPGHNSGKWTHELAYGQSNAKSVQSPSQLIFETRRQVRVYSGTTLIETLTTGSEIRTDGTSTAGSTYPDRLYITGYRRAGATQWKYFSSNTWAETGIRAGYYTWPSIKN